MENSNGKIDLFISYLEKHINNESISQIFIIRSHDIIQYGSVKNGVRMIEDSFELEKNTDLQKIFSIIQNGYSINIIDNNLDSITKNYIITSWINNHVKFEIGSDDMSDIKWFYSMINNNENSLKKG